MIPNIKNVKLGTLQIAKVMKGDMLVWENWVHGTDWRLTNDFENHGCSYSRPFTKQIKIISGHFKLRTAGGRNYPYSVKIRKTDGSWETIASGTMNDTDVKGFGSNTPCTEFSINVCSSNQGVGRYPCDIVIAEYYEKGN